MKVAIDVQHLYRPFPRAHDRGTIYTLAGGGTMAESYCASLYAAGIHEELTHGGAQVLTNNPSTGVLVGDYWKRCRSAKRLGVDLYLACHLNAGRGAYARLEMMAAHRDDTLRHWIGKELVDGFPSIFTCSFTNLAPGERGAVCIRSFDGPAVILEPFFGDNPSQQVLMTAASLAAVGAAIARGILSWDSTRGSGVH